MDKGVIDPVTYGATGSAESADPAESARTSASGLHRHRHRKHHRHQNLSRGAGKGLEIAFVTLIALVILFGVMYMLFQRSEHSNADESMRLAPSHRGAWQGAHPRVLRRELSTGA